jgi:hypothetical protein
MADWRLERVGTICDAHGEEIEIGITYRADPQDADEEPLISIGSAIEFGQEEAEAFARVFVSACWEAARCAGREPHG